MEAHYRLAQVYLKTQEWARAYQELRRTLDLDPENYAARVDIAELTIEGGDFKQAQENTDFLASHHPDDAQIHVLFAKLHAAEGHVEIAVRESKRRSSLRPAESEYCLDLALLQLNMKQFDSAEANFNKAVELEPKAVNARLTLGNYYLSRNRFGEAEQQFRQAMQSEPKNPDPRAALAHVYMSERNPLRL